MNKISKVGKKIKKMEKNEANKLIFKLKELYQKDRIGLNEYLLLYDLALKIRKEIRFLTRFARKMSNTEVNCYPTQDEHNSHYNSLINQQIKKEKKEEKKEEKNENDFSSLEPFYAISVTRQNAKRTLFEKLCYELVEANREKDLLRFELEEFKKNEIMNIKDNEGK